MTRNRLHYWVIRLFYFVFILLTSGSLKAATLKGHILDKNSKEGLIGAIIYNKDDKKVHDAAGLDGSYSIKNIAPGSYTFVVEYIGYVKQEQSVTLKSADEAVNLDFLLEVNSVKLGDVNIVAKQDKESDTYARDLEKNSDNTINVLSAKTMQLLPDVTVGSVLQRVSGVTVEKTASGEGRYATIRGMDKRYNYTTIDGVKVPSPDNQNRYVPMDIFPSDILERLEVIKSLTPNLEADAIGGVMNLVLKDAPDHFVLSANASSGVNQTLLNRSYNQYSIGSINNQSPEQIHGPAYMATTADFPRSILDYKAVGATPNLTAGFTIGKRFLNNKLGILVSGSYQDMFSGTSSLFIEPDGQPGYVPANAPAFTKVQVRSYSMEQKRAAIQAKLDYEFNTRHKITFYTLFTGQQEIRQRQYSDTSVAVPIGEVTYHYESRVTNQQIFTTVLKGRDSLIQNLTLDWTIAYSDATGDQPDWTSYDYIAKTSTSGVWNSMTSRWLSNTDEDLSIYGNLTYRLKIAKPWYDKLFGANGVEFKAGAMNRNKNRSNYLSQYDFVPTPNNQPSSLSINSTIFALIDPQGTPQDANNYVMQENVNAYYGMAKFNLGPRFELLGGLRAENTTQAYVTTEPVTIPGQSGGKTYGDILPSAQVKFLLTEKQHIRASYFASITRPGYFDLVPFTVTGEYFNSMGNPYLRHTQADNYDLRYEFFPKPSEQLLVGVFYKDITDAIEQRLVRGSGPSAQFLKPFNAPNVATNYGVELVYNVYFLKYFGIGANYTYTKSQVVDTVISYYKGPSGNTNKFVTETRPLQGQADNIANLSFMYKNPKIGLDAQISVVYTGLLIAQVSPFQNWDYWQMPMTRLDFSFEKRLSRKYNLNLYCKIGNILNTGTTIRELQALPAIYSNSSQATYLPGQSSVYSLMEQKTYNSSNSIVVQKEVYGQSYSLGLRFKF